MPPEPVTTPSNRTFQCLADVHQGLSPIHPVVRQQDDVERPLWLALPQRCDLPVQAAQHRLEPGRAPPMSRTVAKGEVGEEDIRLRGCERLDRGIRLPR